VRWVKPDTSTAGPVTVPIASNTHATDTDANAAAHAGAHAGAHATANIAADTAADTVADTTGSHAEWQWASMLETDSTKDKPISGPDILREPILHRSASEFY